jgi:hypothetical protein
MAKNIRGSYLSSQNRQDINQIFDDLDKLRDFCRDKMLPFDEADLYNRSSPVWNRYYNYTQKKIRIENNQKR